MGSREGTILYGLKNGKSIADIERALKNNKYSPLTDAELFRFKKQGVNTGNPVYDIPKNIGGDLGEMAKGLNTAYMLGVLGTKKLIKQPKETSEKISKYIFNKGIGGISKDVANAMLSTYNTRVEDFGKLPTGEILQNVGQGIYDNPLFFAMDVAPATKLLPKGITKPIRSGLSKATKGFIPSAEQQTVNDIIKRNKVLNEVKTSPIQKEIVGIKNNPRVNMGQVSRNLITGTSVGNKATLDATKRMGKVIDETNKILHKEFSLSPEVTKQETISKYILENINPSTAGKRVRDINVDLVKQDMARVYNGLPSQLGIEDLMKSGGELYDAGKIKHVSEVLRPTPSDIIGGTTVEKNAFLTPRLQGLTTPEQLGDVLADTYQFLNKQITKSRTALDSFNDISKKLGTKISKEEIGNIDKGRVAVSPELLHKQLGASLYGGNQKKINKILTEALSPSQRSLQNANEIYSVDKDLFRGLINAQNFSSGNKANALFKLAQLTTPKWFLENRIGNTLLNAVEGVSPIDYLQANRHFGKYKDLVPKALEQQTSYSGYLGSNFAGSKTLDALKGNVLGGYQSIRTGHPLDALYHGNQAFASLVVSPEASFEKMDRFANMIRQAKRYSKANNLNVDDVIKSLDKDTELYNKLANKVDASLGDYIGRNYFAPPIIHNTANWVMPFYKFPTQSGMVLARQAVNNPLRMQALFNTPSKYGREFYNRQAEETGIRPDLGGVVTELSPTPRRASVVERFGANPLSAPLELGYELSTGKGEDLVNNLSPLLSDVWRIGTFRDKYGNILSMPETINVGNQALLRDKSGKPTKEIVSPNELPSGARGKAIISTLANRFITPVVQMNRGVLPAVALSRGEEYYPNYDTTVMGQVGDVSAPFLLQGRVEKEGRAGATGLIGNWMGIRQSKEYPERLVNKSMLRQAYRKYARQLREKEGK